MPPSEAEPHRHRMIISPRACVASGRWHSCAILLIFAGNLVVVPLSALLVLAWARRSRTPWREIGYVRPQSWIGSLAVGIAFGIAFKFLMKAIVMPLLGADPINQAYHYLVGNAAALPACCSP